MLELWAVFCDVVGVVVVLEITAPLELVTVVVTAPSAAVATVVVSPDEEDVVVVVVVPPEDTLETAEAKLETAGVLLVPAEAEPEPAAEFNAASALETPLIPLIDIA